jgi:hypothetical protein
MQRSRGGNAPVEPCTARCKYAAVGKIQTDAPKNPPSLGAKFPGPRRKRGK